MERRRTASLVIAMMAGAGVSYHGHAQWTDADVVQLDLPVLSATAPEEGKPDVYAWCSETVPSFGVATLTWSSYPRFDRRQRIDLTVYANGFEQDRFAVLWPLERGQRPWALKKSRLRESDPTLTPRLAGLQTDPERDTVTVRLELLSGGLAYQLRLVTFSGKGWEAGPSVRISAPVCITEE